MVRAAIVIGAGRVRNAVLVACLAAGVSGCIPYPVYKQLQPHTRVRVVDPAGVPLTGAGVSLISRAYPHGGEHLEVRPTDAQGLATFDERREWRTESLMVHGWQEFFWNLCVAMPGHATHLTTHRSGSTFDANPTIVLSPGASTPCPTR